MKKKRLGRGVIVLLFTFLALTLSACGDPRLTTFSPNGTNAEESLYLIKLSAYIMFAVMAVVFVLLLYVIIRFRAKSDDTSIPKQVEGSTLLEFIWTAIPVIIIIFLAVITINMTFSMAQDHSEDPDAVKLEVIAHQYWWEFRYPELGIVTAQDLYIPKGKKIAATLRGDDVIHSFWVPNLTGKIDTNPGYNRDGTLQNVNRFTFDSKTTGIFLGKCAELCGPSHPLMEFKVIALEPADFEAWVAKMKEPVQVKGQTAVQGEKIFQQNCAACHAVDASDQAKRPGPNLANIGNRLTIAGYLPAETEADMRESLVKWIEEPNRYKPQNEQATVKTVVMPPFKDKLSKEEMNELIDFLLEQKQYDPANFKIGTEVK
ncbi:MAG: Cytochrome c oxidase polypeptide II [Candidatus Carbobacillus altaicus]|uniref:Cytochrome c oxidase subunit 2 n=1 Tax=Candidatus Carbonibacillus altaicus TaxID=2163959 RepID=A0A2R6Y4C8_9BACL|nr:MAG: Cytochrome c oxidase polypeptide II [Candidatus Carbobacillus altaicus]